MMRRNEELDRELGRDQCAEQERDVCDVQSDVEHGALRAAEDREPGEQRHLGRARPAEVERAAERWIVSTRERAAAAAETEPFEGHAPEHGLLKCDRFVVPGAEASELAQARREGAEEAPRPDVEDDLQDVHDVDRRGGSVALQGPGLAHHLHSLGERLGLPFADVVRRKDGLQKRHGRHAIDLLAPCHRRSTRKNANGAPLLKRPGWP